MLQQFFNLIFHNLVQHKINPLKRKISITIENYFAEEFPEVAKHILNK